MTDRLPLVRKGGQNVQQPVGDSLRLVGPLNQSDFLSVAAAGTTDLTSIQSDNINVSGSGSISSLGSAASGTFNGSRRVVKFVSASITVAHDPDRLVLFGSNIVTLANDRAEFVYRGAGKWECLWYARADGTALASSGSGGATTYTWTQDTAAAVWTIPHNLNRRPSVTVVDTLGNVIVPDISYVDSNTVQVTHGAAYAGKAYLN
jgi:hypothetical protein